jgi:hypothetical protein
MLGVRKAISMCGECVKAQLRKRARCPYHARLLSEKKKRSRDRELWTQLQRDGWESLEELADDLREVRKAHVSPWDIPKHLKAAAGKGRERLSAADLLPKQNIADRLMNLE